MIQVMFKDAAGAVTMVTADNLHVSDKMIRSEHEYTTAKNSALGDFIPPLGARRGTISPDQPVLVPNVVTLTVLGVTQDATYDVPNLTASDIVSMANTQRIAGAHFAAIDVRNKQDENAVKLAAQRPAGNGKPVLNFSNH